MDAYFRFVNLSLSRILVSKDHRSLTRSGFKHQANTGYVNSSWTPLPSLGTGRRRYTVPQIVDLDGEWTGFKAGATRMDGYRDLMKEATGPLTMLYAYGGNFTCVISPNLFFHSKSFNGMAKRYIQFQRTCHVPCDCHKASRAHRQQVFHCQLSACSTEPISSSSSGSLHRLPLTSLSTSRLQAQPDFIIPHRPHW